jgi:two-component system cell cycle response regulator
MSARILVVDDNPLNVKLLSAKLAREYYTVLTAENGLQALEVVEKEKPDLVLLDVMMPELDGFETCRRIKGNPVSKNTPVVMVTALSDVQDRVQGLDAGADDFLTKPINDIALMARVRSCLRLKSLMDEWCMREGAAAPLPDIDIETLRSVHIALIDDQPHESEMVGKHIERVGMNLHALEKSEDLQTLMQGHVVDVALINLNMQNDDSLRMIANMRASEETRTIPIVTYADESDIGRIAKALDLGANDYIFKPVDALELHARLRTQIRNKRTYDKLRLSYERNMTMAITDPLTGAYNRHYLDQTVPRLFERYHSSHKPIAVAISDIDFFKKVNDTYGHHVGDQVLQEMVKRLNAGLRFFDIVVRMGGEEFAIVMPDTPYEAAMSVAERLRASIEAKPFVITEPKLEIPVTMSIGVCGSDDGQSDMETLYKAADQSLYKAKESGRNRVVGKL